ncbi:hypothetical protein [Maioricimonas sp. JC845]|uniref:hypothetical protein n=1 Tax=Maioricimonas sp. JC845 TaxID=3232138 RepID=UPI00345A74E2
MPIDRGNVTSVCLVSLFISASLTFSTCLGADDDLKQRFLSEAPEAWSQYRVRAEHIQGAVTFTQTNRGSSERALRSTERQITVFDRNALVISERENRNSEYLKTAVGVNSDYAFRVQFDSDARQWVLTDLDRDVQDVELSSLAEGPKELALGLVCRGMRVFGTWLPEMVSEPGFRVNQVLTFEQGSTQLVRVEFDYEPQQHRNNPVRGGTILLDPSRYWLIREAKVRAFWMPGEEGTITVQVEYADDEVNSFPLLTRYVAHVDAQLSGDRAKEAGINEVHHDWVWNFDLRELENASERDFTLAAFGLPEPSDRLDAGSQSGSWGTLLVLANLCFLVAIGLWWLNRRRYPGENAGSP